MDRDERGTAIEAILEGVRAGSVRSANQLCARMWPLVFGYCYHRLRQAASAEDAAQEAMLEIVRRAGEVRVPAALWSYSRLVARKHCDRQTRRKRAETAELTELPDPRRPDPLAEFLAKDERRRVVDALWSLSPGLRVAMVLYYLHQERTAEIAAFLGTSVEAVKKRLSDGRKKLKGRMAMVEGVLRDFGGLVRMSNRNVQKLLRELEAEDLGQVLHVVVPELRAKLESNVSRRTLARLRAVRRDDERGKAAVDRFWRAVDAMLERGVIDFSPGGEPPEAGEPVAAMAIEPGRKDREAWLRRALRELSAKARRYGLFSLEGDAGRCPDPLLREGLEAVVDGVPPEEIRSRLRVRGRGEHERIVEEGVLAIQQGKAL